MIASLAAAAAALFTPADLASPPPAAPPPGLSAVLGLYGPDEGLVAVGEEAGRLRAVRLGDAPAPAGEFRLVRGPREDVVAIEIGGVALVRRDAGAEVEQAIRQAARRADPARLRAESLSAAPPAEPEPRRVSELVDLATLDPAIRLDVRYAGAENFMGFPLYEQPRAFLQRPAAEALARVQARLAARGYGLLVFDAYRPWFVTRMFWEATPEASRMFVADPAQGSRHNRGAAVDLTLYDLATGQAVDMPSRYDEFSPRAYADFPGGAARERWFRALLRQEMETEGFAVLAEEWWHFDFAGYADWGIGTATFEDLAGR